MIAALAPLLEAVKKAGPSIYAAVFVASSLLLFGPAPFLNSLGLREGVERYRFFIGLAFVGSVSLLLASGGQTAGKLLSQKVVEWRLNQRAIRHLRDLTEEEKAFLRLFIVKKKNTVEAYMPHGIAGGLVAKKLIFCSSNFSSEYMVFPFNLQPYVRRILERKPDFLA